MLITITSAAVIRCRCPEYAAWDWMLYGAVPVLVVVITAVLQVRRSRSDEAQVHDGSAGNVASAPLSGQAGEGSVSDGFRSS